MQRPRFPVAFVGDTAFNLPGARPASIHDLLWQHDLPAFHVQFMGAMLNPKKAKLLVSHWNGRSFGREDEPFPFALRV